ncbi:hypothetical protein TNCV_2747251 [Trichonephila clavipes]|nr:hypothetical protein TNCV_2747251 [Trichonephila clavipes]
MPWGAEAGKAIGIGETVGVGSCICNGVVLCLFSLFQSLFLGEIRSRKRKGHVMYSHFCVDVFSETILLLVQVPFARFTFETSGWRGNCGGILLSARSREPRGRLPLGPQRRGVHQEYFPLRTYLTGEMSLVPDGKWVFGEYHRILPLQCHRDDTK